MGPSDYDAWFPGGYHSFSERPRSLLFQHLSLEPLPGRERYEFFDSEVLVGFALRRPDATQRHGFHAEVTSMATAASGMHAARVDAFRCERHVRHVRRDGGRECSLLYMKSGRMRLDATGDRAASAGPGEFVFLDGIRPLSLEFEAAEFVQLDLLRAVHAACLDRLPAPSAVGAVLNRSPLRRLLGAQLGLFPSASADMSDDERALQLASTEHLALAVLQSVGGEALQDGHARADAAMFHAAQRYIGQCLHQATLDPGQVATALGCSRATLYRVFAAHGGSVGAAIREARLRRAHELLRTLPHAPVGDVAARCGFFDLRSFHRAFRARFGRAPGRVREEAVASAARDGPAS